MGAAPPPTRLTCLVLTEQWDNASREKLPCKEQSIVLSMFSLYRVRIVSVRKTLVACLT